VRTEAVTVVIPTRNRPDLLSLTLTSVLRQRDVDLLVVVVDDASTEDTAGMIARVGDPRVRIAQQPRSEGVSVARNRGLWEATTEWVAFCDDDDLWSPDKLCRQLAIARSLDRDWAYAGCVYVNTGLIAQGGAPPLEPAAMSAALRRYNAMPAGASNVVGRAEVLKHLGGFDARKTHLPDWDLWLRLVDHGLAACVQEPLVGYRIHAGNASFRTAEMLAELDGFERQHGLRTNRSRFLRHLAHLCLRSGRHSEALGYFVRALLRFRDGYDGVDLLNDGRLLRAHVTAIARRRLRLPPSARATRRLGAWRGRDPNAAWKAQAQAWLNTLAR
jgi:glycosyltransferase involved in cell wall biosynthesis